ncbi:hypothetical protein QTP88_003333 [Uroleucon formosanum]
MYNNYDENIKALKGHCFELSDSDENFDDKEKDRTYKPPMIYPEDGEKVLWNSIKVIKIDKMNPLIMKYKTSYSQDSFKIVNIRQKKRKPLNLIPEIKILDTPAKISNEKKKDLLSLCHSGAIPKNHWAFYESLQSEVTEGETDD